MNDDLASGFQDVDGASHFAVFSGCLSLVDSIPFFADIKLKLGVTIKAAKLTHRR